MNGSDDIEIQEGRQIPVEDRIDEFEYADLVNDAKKEMEYEKITSDYKIDLRRCDICGNIFNEDDLNIVNDKWLCRSCEEDLK